MTKSCYILNMNYYYSTAPEVKIWKEACTVDKPWIAAYTDGTFLGPFASAEDAIAAGVFT